MRLLGSDYVITLKQLPSGTIGECPDGTAIMRAKETEGFTIDHAVVKQESVVGLLTLRHLALGSKIIGWHIINNSGRLECGANYVIVRARGQKADKLIRFKAHQVVNTEPFSIYEVPDRVSLLCFSNLPDVVL